jgi:hypothetical protein
MSLYPQEDFLTPSSTVTTSYTPVSNNAPSLPAVIDSPLLVTPNLSFEKKEPVQQAPTSTGVQQDLLQMFSQTQDYFQKIMNYMQSVDSRLTALERITKEINENQKQLIKDQSTPVIDTKEREREDFELARKLQAELNAEQDRIRQSAVTTTIPKPIETKKEILADCPFCEVRLPFVEMEDHVNRHLDQQDSGKKIPDDKKGPNPAATPGNNTSFFGKLFGTTPAPATTSPTPNKPAEPPKTTTPSKTPEPPVVPTPTSMPQLPPGYAPFMPGQGFFPGYMPPQAMVYRGPNGQQFAAPMGFPAPYAAPMLYPTDPSAVPAPKQQ